MIEEVSDISFEEYVKRNPKTVAYFYGINCLSCNHLSPVIEELSGENGKVKFIKLNDVESAKTFRQNNVTAMPTVILFKDGEEKTRLNGRIIKQKLRELIDTW